jgi:hypothetical protein
MAVRSKMADQNHFFCITLRVSNILSFFFLYSFGVGKMQILWNFFLKKFKMADGMQTPVQTVFLDFLKNFFPQNLRLTNVLPNECKKKIDKM